MKRLTETHRVRICAYPADWLLEDGFANSTKINWSTGQKTKRGDIQVFAVSSTLKNAPELKHDARRNAVHSIWRAVSPPKDEYWEEQYPVQADFRRLVKLKNPVPKAELIRARLLNKQWPHH
jgi:hypothetical protein